MLEDNELFKEAKEHNFVFTYTFPREWWEKIQVVVKKKLDQLREILSIW